MKRNHWLLLGASPFALILAAVLIYQIPSVHHRFSWRVDSTWTYIRNVINPAGQMPTPKAVAALPQPRVSITRQPTAPVQAVANVTALPTPTPTLTPTPLPPPPASAELPPPEYELQDQNNCGPASLSLNLRFFGWKGDQYTISEIIKPQMNDRNVNVDELIYFVRTNAGWLNAEYRVGGTLEQLKHFIAAGIPIMIEEESRLDKQYWPGDDLWAGHYLLLTAYDDATQTFTTQDTWLGANLKVPYATLDKRWQTFNRVYIMIYPPEQEETVKAIVGPDWDVDMNRTNALKSAQAETQTDPRNPYSWFNLGTNLLYFERYTEAAAAYDTARTYKLPQRMLRYQFGPFISYFHTNRNDDLLALSEYALKITPNSEENLLWYGWALFREGQREKAVEQWTKALEQNPFYTDAQYALNYAGTN